MDVNLHTMMLQNVPSIELNRRLLQNEINSRRVAQILVEAAQLDLDLLPIRNHSRTTYYAELDPYNATVSAANRSADEYSEVVTTARYADDVTRTVGGNTSTRVNLNLARKRLRSTLPKRVTPRTADQSFAITKDDFAAINRTASAARRPPVTSYWNLLSISSANRTGVEDEWNSSNDTTLAISDISTSHSIYCPSIPPGLREFWLYTWLLIRFT